MEWVLRFAIGGVVVSMFSVLGDLLRPKSFAGLFGAAPSVALATLALTLWKEGSVYAALEGQAMMLGAASLAIYSACVCQCLVRFRLSSIYSSTGLLIAWLGLVLALKTAVLS
jgi:hypothetical protein